MFDASLRCDRLGGPDRRRRLRLGPGAADPGQPAPGQERRRARLLLGQLPQARSRAAARRLPGAVRLASPRAGSGRTSRRPCRWRRRPTPSGLLARAAQHRQGRGDRALARTSVRQPSAADDATPVALAPRRARGLSQRAMNGLKLVIGSKNGSSWSLAALAAAASRSASPFEEIADPAAPGRTRRARIRRHSPSGKVPVLLAGEPADLGFAGDRRIPGRAASRPCGRPIRARGRSPGRSAPRCTAALRPCAPSCPWISPPASGRRASC